MEQFGVPEGFNPSEDFESAHDCFDEPGHWFCEFVNYV